MNEENKMAQPVAIPDRWRLVPVKLTPPRVYPDILAASPPPPDSIADAAHTDDIAVDEFAAAMKSKLAEARAKGRSGWEECDPVQLSIYLREHVGKGDPRDVANFCMMLWHHEAPISADAAKPVEAKSDQIDFYASTIASAMLGQPAEEDFNEVRQLLIEFAATQPTAIPSAAQAATNCTIDGGNVEGNQVFVSMDAEPDGALWKIGARAFLSPEGAAIRSAGLDALVPILREAIIWGRQQRHGSLEAEFAAATTKKIESLVALASAAAEPVNSAGLLKPFGYTVASSLKEEGSGTITPTKVWEGQVPVYLDTTAAEVRREALDENELWDLLDTVDEALSRRAAPHAWESVVRTAGCDFIVKRRQRLQSTPAQDGGEA